MRDVHRLPRSLAICVSGVRKGPLPRITPRWFGMPIHGRWLADTAWTTAPHNDARDNHQRNKEQCTTRHSAWVARCAHRLTSVK